LPSQGPTTSQPASQAHPARPTNNTDDRHATTTHAHTHTTHAHKQQTVAG
jgi:hypothetical protein